MSFLTELKRRNVFKIGIAYLVASWLILQLLSIVLPAFEAPAWIIQVAMLFLGLGFFISMFVAWAFELTPEGVKPTSTVNPEDSITPQTGQKLNFVIIGVLVLAVLAMALDSYVFTEATAPDADIVSSLANETDQLSNANSSTDQTTTDKTIAVLPFTNLSDVADQEYFSDGLTEELINTLSAVDGLQVTGRTSVFFFKDSDLNTEEIADTLGVSFILQGSVRKSGNQLRISTTLMDANNGYNLWSETFDRQLEDIFVLQDEIAQAVSTALSVTLSAGEFNRPGMTTNVAAYDEYLKGQDVFNGTSSSSQDILFPQMQHFEQAVTLDPDFAIAWFRLGDIYALSDAFSDSEQAQRYSEQATQAYDNASRIAPDMRAVKFRQLSQLGSDAFLNTEILFQEYYSEIGNSDAELNSSYSNFLQLVGRQKEALIYAQRAYRADPFDPVRVTNLAQILMATRQYPEAREMLEKSLMLLDYQEGTGTYAEMAFLNILEEDWDTAIESTQKLVATREPQTLILEYMKAGDYSGGLSEAQRIFDAEETTGVMRSRHLVPLAALMGDPELALQFTLDSGIYGGLRQLWWEFGDDVRPLPGFKNLVQDFGLAEYWLASGNWPDQCQPLANTDNDFECF